MPICKKCNEKFPNRIWIGGKYKNIHHRSYCLSCSPIDQRLRSGPLPKDGSDPFDKGKDKYPSGRVRPNPRKAICPDCNKEFLKKHRNLICNTCKAKKARAKVKQELVEYKGGKCVCCGYDNWKVLNFHHMNSEEKDFNLSSLYGSKEKKLLFKEADKCVLLCSNCHAEVHLGLKEIPNINAPVAKLADALETLGVIKSGKNGEG